MPRNEAPPATVCLCHAGAPPAPVLWLSHCQKVRLCAGPPRVAGAHARAPVRLAAPNSCQTSPQALALLCRRASARQRAGWRRISRAVFVRTALRFPAPRAVRSAECRLTAPSASPQARRAHSGPARVVAAAPGQCVFYCGCVRHAAAARFGWWTAYKATCSFCRAPECCACADAHTRSPAALPLCR